MSRIRFSWFTPTNGDGAHIGLKKPEREPSLEYVVKVAQMVEKSGFDGILVPVGTPYFDSWMVGSAIVHNTNTLRPLIAIRPGFITPSLSAKMASTLDLFSGGRLDINIVAGGSAHELGQDGDFVDHDTRYTRANDFMEVMNRLWEEEHFDHDGPHYQIKDGLLVPKNIQRRIPAFFGASSDAGKDATARYGDVYLQWGEPVEEVRAQIEDVNRRAAAYGRTMEHGIRIHVIVRETEEEAWKEADRLVSIVDPAVEARMREYYKESDSVAQSRMSVLLKGDFRFGKFKWAGIGRVRKGAGTAVVGTPEQVREGLQEYIDAGVTHFILSGFPHLEEAERVGKTVLPLFNQNQKESSLQTN
ncbi:LLM class flavin-dependent oxidoreductase [Paenibacillus koleovorans]|uniref:LLM class flavin-dependent oxidoreductase n=1 Tax=Paenibacillus koleovorans TaxID=121608 RepID=UPI000FD9AE59|nr:LLM class flavin-dependent oxidoreductase [Paenibacillus koleovorans]